MQIDIENLKVELNKRVPRLSNYNKTELRVDNNEVRFRITAHEGLFTTEVDLDSKSYDRVLDELALKVQGIIDKIEAKTK